ncbi:MAG TPA: non-ribosomal peptide synthetase, partial [Pilimelia sp.]|nr:non-ribosomal peptide synthetase [Pilimelia sp.]
MPFVRALAGHGDRPALITATGRLTYRELADRVAAAAHRLGGGRRLVLLAGANTVDAVVYYLAALSAGHPLLLAPGDRPEAVAALVAAYDPDVVVRPAAGRHQVRQRRRGSAHAPHPDLALLLSTSGSTGSPKLVRLSADNLQANAEAIAEYLAIRPDDRAATTLPMHYCYGLSVINSHLLRGAGLVLTDLSVAEPRFWELFRAARGTSFAGVPYTFELLDRIGFADLRLPHLRYVTQAGGRLAPDRVARYAALGRRAGWDLFVMYGQTEATARMAYLPPELAAEHPDAIGVPIPGGAFRIAPLPDEPDAEPGTGELVYTGRNVMLGYAEHPADLSRGRTVWELRTGDLARRTDDGLYVLVGRRSQFVKVAGLRIDPQRVEELLARHGVTACCAGGGADELVVAVERARRDGGLDAAGVRRLVARTYGLPAQAVRVPVVPELPRLSTGKPDRRAVAGLAGPADRAGAPAAPDPGDAGATPHRPGAVPGPRRPGSAVPAPSPEAAAAPAPPTAEQLCRLYAEILDRTGVTPADSFVSLGGDSLSYVEASVRLERILGRLPSDWHDTPIARLVAAGRPAAPRRR